MAKAKRDAKLDEAANSRVRLRPGTRAVPGSKLTLAEIQKLQFDAGRWVRRSTRDENGDPFPSSTVCSEVTRVVEERGLAEAADRFGVDPDSIAKIVKGFSVLQRTLTLVERVIFPTPEQRVALQVMADRAQDVGGVTVQIHQNLTRKGWAKFLDAAGKMTDSAAEALTVHITPEGERALKLANKKTRHAGELSGTYKVGSLPKLTRVHGLRR